MHELRQPQREPEENDRGLRRREGVRVLARARESLQNRSNKPYVLKRSCVADLANGSIRAEGDWYVYLIKKTPVLVKQDRRWCRKSQAGFGSCAAASSRLCLPHTPV
jgi:hypothetical protein